MASRGYGVGFERTLGWGFASLAAAYSATWFAAGVAQGGATGPWLWSGIGLGVFAAGLTLRRASRHAVGPADVVRFLVVEIAILAAWALEGTASITGGLRVTAPVVVVLGSFAFLRAGLREAFVVVAVGLGFAADVATVGLGAAIEGMMPVLAVGVSGAAVLATVRRAARQADAAADEARAGLRRVAEEEAGLRVEEELRGVLHDHVAAALRAVSTSRGSSRSAREASRDAAAAIAAFHDEAADDAPVSLTAALREIADSVGVVRVFATTAVPVPPEVSRALCGAVAEAVRNAQRHGSPSRVDVVVADEDAVVTVSVTDDGGGFDPSHALASSHGIRYSIIRRVEAVGGSASVASAPGEETTVRLTWSRRPDEGDARIRSVAARAQPVVGDLRVSLAWVFGPYLALNVVYSVWHAVNGDLPWWPLVWLAGLVAISAVLLVRLDAPPSGFESALYGVFVVAGTAAVFAILPAGSLHDYAAWPVGAGGQILALLVVARPRWEGVTATGLLQVVIVVAVVTGRYEPGHWPEPLGNVLTAMASVLIPVALAWAVPETLARLGDAIEHSRKAVTVRLTERFAARARARAARRWVADPEAEVLSFLGAVVERRISTLDPATRAAARALESSVRDELVIPGVLDAHSRQLLRRARSGGTRVVFQAGHFGGFEPEVMRALVSASVSTETMPQEVTVSMLGRGPATAACVVVVPGGLGVEEALATALGPRLRLVQSSAEVTWAEVSTTAT
jgi:two-component sensor histidine kinase